jgi:hypothetical protein
VIVEATFTSNLLETLRKALNHEVEIDVEVVEEKRPYERTARNRIMSVVEVRQLGGATGDPEPSVEGTEVNAEAEAPEADAAG